MVTCHDSVCDIRIQGRCESEAKVSFSIVICSRNVTNLTACVQRLREKGEAARVIVVWDNQSGFRDENGEPFLPADPSDFGLQMEIGIQPFGFARNSNIGIRAAGDDDVILCNDDILLETPGGFTRIAGYANSRGGEGMIVSPRVRGPAFPVHARRPSDPVNTFTPVARGHWLPFACVMIPRRILRVVGELDEQFSPGGYEDNDYCRRAQKANFFLGVANDVIVDHQTLPHTFRPEGKPDLYDLPENKQRFEEKWRGK